jgi:succinoglycan biosynthesis transport protein ExoP
MEAKTTNFAEHLAMLRRRRTRILGTVAALFGAAVAIALILPPAYRSTATILIEEQEVPVDLVRSTISSYADQRIQTIRHQVMTRPNLLKIVEQYGLYEGLRRRSTTEDVLERMTDDIHLDVISADVVDRFTHQPIKATIAFTLAYDGETPAAAQKVANELTSLFLAENLKSRERHAQETTMFLKQEAENLAERLTELEKQLSDFKQTAKGALPELVQLNMQLLSQAEREQTDTEQRLNAMEERRNYLEGQLATLKPHTPIITAGGERILDAGERLKALQAQLASSAGYLSEDHPDIIKMRQESEALQREDGGNDEGEELRKRLADEHAKIEALLGRYGEDHPDVIRARAAIASLEQQLVQVAEGLPRLQQGARPENPAYIQIQAQLAAANTELEALRASHAEIKRKVRQYADRLERTPQLEPDYLVLVRLRENTEKKYHDLRHRLLEAQVAQELEVQRKGERFSLIDPPDFPQKPEKPNRPAIVLLGLVLALAGGVGAGAAAENLDRSIRTPEMLRVETQVPPLAVIPYIPNTEDRVRESRHRLWRRAGIGASLVLLLALAHLLWMPLDVLWFATLRKLGIG